jgi:hypothetical protein
MMDTRGMTEKGIKKKAAVQAIFTKLLYLSEVREANMPVLALHLWTVC